MKHNDDVKSFPELLWDQDDIRERFSKELFDNDMCSSFDFKPLMMPGLPVEMQLQLSSLEYELKLFYLLTASMKKLCNSDTVVTAVDIQLAEVGVETVYYHHSEIIHDIQEFRRDVMLKRCLSGANLAKVKQYCEENINAATDMLKMSVKLVERYGNIFSSVPKYHYYEEEES